MRTTKFEVKYGINISHRKEKNFSDCYQVITFDAKKKSEIDSGFRVLVDLREYHTNTKSYACIWLNDNIKDLHGSGSGSASGYGYHRGSAAVSEAIQRMGIELSEDISGRGDSAIELALHAIAKRLGYKNYFVNHTHA